MLVLTLIFELGFRQQLIHKQNQFNLVSVQSFYVSFLVFQKDTLQGVWEPILAANVILFIFAQFDFSFQKLHLFPLKWLSVF